MAKKNSQAIGQIKEESENFFKKEERHSICYVNRDGYDYNMYRKIEPPTTVRTSCMMFKKKKSKNKKQGPRWQ
jgi:hypothetical protein